MALFKDTHDQEEITDDIKDSEPKLHLKMKSRSWTPLLESLQTPSTLTPLSETPPPQFPLTKQNSKEWTIKDFNEYEKQLKEKMTDLKIQLKNSLTDNKSTGYVIKHKRKNKRRHSSLSLQNFQEWSQNEMNEYEKELMIQFIHLSNQITPVKQILHGEL
eukprot:832526_1